MVTVRCSAYAHETITRIYAAGEASGNEGSVEATLARFVRRALDDFIPHHARDSKFAIGHGHYRTKGSRHRLTWVASSTTAVILTVGMRKKGDRNDVYAVLARYIQNGDFDEIYKVLGTTRPPAAFVKDLLNWAGR